MSIVKVENIDKSYNLGSMELRVLKNLDFHVDQGEYVAIMGPSGSGKSTLLNLLGCLDRPTRGRYYLDGDDVSQMDDDELSTIRGARIGFIFQSYNLIPQLDVIENIEVPMYYQGISEKESYDRAYELADMVGLSDRIRHRPSELSGGQQQRVAIARALANDPVLIMADEPTGNLDSHSGREILDILDKLHDRGKTLIAITHGFDIADRADRVVHLLDGSVEKIECRKKPSIEPGG